MNNGITPSADLEKLITEARQTEDNKAPITSKGIAIIDGAPHIAVAVRMTTYEVRDGKEVDISTDHVMVFSRVIDSAYLEQLSKGYMLTGLEQAATPPTTFQAGLRLDTNPSGAAEPVYLVWRPELPGVPAELVPFVLFIFLVMGYAAYWFVRQTRGVAIDLEMAHADAAEANSAKTDFLRNLAHEIRTPVNAILGFAEVMRLKTFGPLGSAKYEEYVDDISKAGNHMLTLVSDLLDLEKIEAGALVIDRETLAIPDVAEDALAYLREMAREKNLELFNRVPAALPPIESDKRLLRQILLNLLGNAVKFTPSGGRVECRASAEMDSFFVIQVIDSGPGIEPALIPDLLEPFSQTEQGRDAKERSSGLGLAITNKIVKALGGEFTLESAPGVGTTATIRLPIA